MKNSHHHSQVNRQNNSDMKDDGRMDSEQVAIKFLNEDPFDAIDYSNNLSVQDDTN